MAITATDIAKRVGVSQGTVSSVLNGNGAKARIAQATQEKILAVAKELRYRPSFAGRALVRGRTRSIGFLCGDIRNPHFNELADLAMEEVERRGFHLVLAVTKWHTAKNDLETFDNLLARGVDGIISFGSAVRKGTPQYAQLRAEKFPFVCIGHAVAGLPCIISDNHPGTDEAVRLCQANGHRRLAYVGLPEPAKERPLADAAARHGVSLDTYHVPMRPGQWAQVSACAREAAHRFAKLPERPTAVFTSSDHLAVDFASGLWEMGVRIPDEVSLIGHDGTAAGGAMSPPLTSIDFDGAQVLQLALDMVFAQLEGRPAAVEPVAVPSRLLVRKSVSLVS